MLNMALAAKKKTDTVSKKTFIKWDGHEDFDAEFGDDGDVILLKCKICTVNINEIRKEAKTQNICGNVLYGDGVRGGHRGNFMRHIKAGGLHD